MSNEGHKAQNMFDAIMSFFQLHDINIQNCRGQSYDNASVMRGQYNGLQALVNRENPLTLWIPCFVQSLNLVGTAAMECCLETKQFSDFLENIYTFFTSSSECHDLLVTKLNQFLADDQNRIIVPKRVSTTRWGSRAEAVSSIYHGSEAYKIVFSELSNENNEARELYKIMSRLETGIYIVFWNTILQRVNATSLKLQSCNADLNTSIALLKSLRQYIESTRNDFQNYETLGKLKSACDEYKQSEERARKRNVRLDPLDYGRSQKVELTGSQKFRVQCYLPIIDQLITSLTQTIRAYQESESYFGFLRNLHELSTEEIQKYSLKALEFYKDDLEENLTSELVQFKAFSKEFILNNRNKDNKTDICVEAKMYQLIIEKDLQDVFPNTCILLKMYLVVMTTNCTSERSFSKLKLIFSRLRASMTQNRLNCLFLMNIEYDFLKEISYSDIIDDFAEKKSRKVFI